MIQNNYLLNKKVFKNYKKEVKQLNKNLEKNNLVILSGIKHIGKTSVLSEFIKENAIEKDFLYINKSLDFENNIKSGNDLINLVKDNKKIKYIILQNISNIKKIKDTIGFLYNSKHKTIIVGNNIKIPSVPEIEVKTKLEKYSLEYGNLGKTSLIGDMDFKKEYLNLIKNDLINEDIIFKKWLKSNNSYNYTISFISKISSFKSIREYHRELEKIEEISLKTFMDYISFSTQAKIINQIYLYDCKKEDIISSKSKFYFTDNGIRNSISNYSLNKIGRASCRERVYAPV